jgi:hypothetical protein
MKKIITTLVFVAMSTVSSKAIELPTLPELPDFGMLSVTAGLSANTGVFGASAKETNRRDDDTIGHIKEEHGVFNDSFSSQFIELGIGQWISVGYEHTPDAITTPTNTTRHGNPAGENNVSVDFNDFDTTYLRLNLPILAGAYIKAGTVETDLDIKESMGSGSTYNNVSADGDIVAMGYQGFLGETGFGFRFETAYLELDDVFSSNGVAADGATVTNGGQNLIEASNLEGLTGKIAITYTLGRNN